MTDLTHAVGATIVQGISGAAGRRSLRLMREYGTEVVAGVVPGRGGTSIDGVPVHDTVAAARRQHPEVRTSLISVAPGRVEDAAMEAMDAGCDVLVVRAERIAHQLMMRVVERAQRDGVLVIGGNSLGLLVPGRGRVGNLGGEVELARRFYTPGPVGVISRSGGNTGTLGWYLSRGDLGQSAVISMGGDAIVGATLVELLEVLQADPRTEVVAYYGEVGSAFEEEAAAAYVAGSLEIPLVAYIAGRYTRPGVRYGHAGAFVDTDGAGTVEEKRRVLRAAGVHVIDHLDAIANTVRRVLQDG